MGPTPGMVILLANPDLGQAQTMVAMVVGMALGMDIVAVMDMDIESGWDLGLGADTDMMDWGMDSVQLP